MWVMSYGWLQYARIPVALRRHGSRKEGTLALAAGGGSAALFPAR